MFAGLVAAADLLGFLVERFPLFAREHLMKLPGNRSCHVIGA
jgi:hypothetical protein